MNIAYASNGAEEVAGEAAVELSKFLQVILTKIPLFIVAFIIILVSMFIAKIAKNIVVNKMAERGIEEEHKELQILGGRITSASIQVIGITAGLKIAGIDLTSIIAAAAFGVGFALKDLIMNFLAGVMILLGRDFTIGDFIKVGSTLGKVVAIQSRVTVLQAVDGTKVIVPNSDLFKKQVVSFTSNPLRRIEVIVKIDYRNNLENALKICDNILSTTKGVLEQPKPAVLVGDFGENSITLKLRAWVKSRGGWLKVKSSLIKNIKSEFEKYGIRIPWPIRTIVNDKESEIIEKMFQAEEIKKEPKQPVAQVVQATVVAEQPVVAPVSTTPAPVQTPATTPPLQQATVAQSDQSLKPLREQR